MSQSCIWVMWCTAGLGLSGPATVLMGMAIETCRPDFTSPHARCTCAGVSRFSVPRMSSSPHRPQFLTDSKMDSNSSMDTFAGRRSMVLIRPLPLLSMSVDRRSNRTAPEPVKDGPALCARGPGPERDLEGRPLAGVRHGGRHRDLQGEGLLLVRPDGQATEAGRGDAEVGRGARAAGLRG